MAKVYVTRRIQAPVDRVWETIRDFNALPQWHPFVASSRIEDDLSGATVGCVRNFELQDDGGTIRERLLALSDVDRLCTYSIVEGPIPVENYLATLRLIEVTEDGTTLGEWQAEFDVSPDDQEQTVALVANIFREGLGKLNEKLAE